MTIVDIVLGCATAKIIVNVVRFRASFIEHALKRRDLNVFRQNHKTLSK